MSLPFFYNQMQGWGKNYFLEIGCCFQNDSAGERGSRNELELHPIQVATFQADNKQVLNNLFLLVFSRFA